MVVISKGGHACYARVDPSGIGMGSYRSAADNISKDKAWGKELHIDARQN